VVRGGWRVVVPLSLIQLFFEDSERDMFQGREARKLFCWQEEIGE
jgi:hypothetical protein